MSEAARAPVAPGGQIEHGGHLAARIEDAVAATAGSSGPLPAHQRRRPGSMSCDLSRIVAAARPMTPGRVQPGKGTTRSVVPVATSSARGCQLTVPSGPSRSMRRRPSPSTPCGRRGSARRHGAVLRAAHRPALPPPTARRLVARVNPAGIGRHNLPARIVVLIDQQHAEAAALRTQRRPRTGRTGTDHEQIDRGER